MRLNKAKGSSIQTYFSPQHKTIFWCNLKLGQEKGLFFDQTRSHAIVPLRYTTSCLHRESAMHEDEG